MGGAFALVRVNAWQVGATAAGADSGVTGPEAAALAAVAAAGARSSHENASSLLTSRSYLVIEYTKSMP
jgi:hypothetical protein